MSLLLVKERNGRRGGTADADGLRILMDIAESLREIVKHLKRPDTPPVERELPAPLPWRPSTEFEWTPCGTQPTRVICETTDGNPR